MKKVLIIVLAIVLATSILVACADTNDTGVINIYLPDGAPALTVAKLMKDFSYKNYTVNIEIVAGAEAIGASLSQNTADIAILPTNVASNLYSKGVDIRLLSSNVFGVLYLVGTEEITDISQLRGETILCIGQGGTPDFMLKYVLEANGIGLDEVTIEYKNDGSEVIPLLKTKANKFAVLGEPAATMSVTNADTQILFDLQAEWEAETGFGGYPQVSTVATADTINNHTAFLKAFVAAMQENVDWVKTNYEEVNTILKEKGSTVKFASNEIIANCNINFVTASEAKANITEYLNIMASYNVAFVGKVPGDEFYVDVASLK